ncbi:MAG TPA: YggT family protein [Actinomycetota bacterium]|jgi:YggT family protein|nr:YggT family protein [Actinomycetota bacterium]
MGGLLCTALAVYSFILLVRVIMSWVQAFGGRIPDALSGPVGFVYQVTEPVLGFFRRYIPPVGMFDISIFFVFILIGVLQRAVCSAGL